MPAPSDMPIVRPRVALVVGNSKYTSVPPLMTSVNDATDVSQVLQKLGFEVTTVIEADYASMKKAVGDFAAKLRTDGYRNALALFYYAGHGTQSNGRNFLLPVDVKIEKGKTNFDSTALDVGEDVVHQFSRMTKGTRPGPNIIILDACRDDPLGGRPGLSRLEVPSGTLLAFAAAAGQQAIDTMDRNKPERNGLYTRFLLQELTTRNRVDMEKFFKILKRKVYEASSQRQDPLIMPNLIEDVFFEPENQRGRASADEVAAWKAIEKSSEVCDFNTFLQKYPNGEFAESARATIEEIRKKDEVARRAFADLPDSVRDQAMKAFKDKAIESEAWCKIQASDDVKDIYEFLEKFPAGKNASRARIRISVIENRDQERRKQEVERQRQQDIEVERQAWAKAGQAEDAATINQFLAKYPSSEYRQAAERRLAELQQRQREVEIKRQETEAWERVRNLKDMAQLESFLARFPAGQYAAQAKQQLDGIHAAIRAQEERLAQARRKEAQDWEAARVGGKSEPLAAFISAYPDSQYRSEARKLLEDLREAEARQLREQAAKAEAQAQAHAQVQAQAQRQEELAWREAETLKRRESYQAFLDRYPASRYGNEARQRIAALEMDEAAENRRREEKQSVAMRETDAWEKIKTSSTPSDFIAFMQTYPEGAHVEEARSRVAALQAMRAQILARQEEQWNKLKASEDLGALKAFVAIPSPFADQALARIAMLEETLTRRMRDEEAVRRTADEDRIWQAALQGRSRESYQAYLSAYPGGRYAAQARAEIGRVMEAQTTAAAASLSPEVQSKMNKAEQGDSDAMYHLALMYEKGFEGIKADPTEMLKWLLLSSNLGNGLSSYKLYAYYAADPTGYSKSIKYRNLAVKQGYCGPPVLGNARGKGGGAGTLCD